MRKYIVLALLFLAAAFGSYRWFAAGDGQAGGGKSAMGAKGPVPVVAEPARRNDLPVQLAVIGRAEAYESVTVRARVEGQVEAVRFTEGQHVRAGDVLITLDTADYRAKLAQAEANLARDQAQLAKAKSDLDRYSNPKTRDFVSAEQLTQVQAAYDAAAATVRADEAAATTARLQLQYATLRAPISGVVGSRLLSPGALVGANNTPVVVINNISPLYVTFSVPEKALPQLRAALRRGPVKTLVTVSGDTGAPMEGTTRFVDNAVDPATGTILAKATLPNRDERLTPGQFVSVQLVLDTLHDLITVPNAAVQQGPKGSYVYLVQADGSAQMRPVEVVLSVGPVTAVRGVNEGEQVVTDGQLRLTPGAKVKLAGAAPPVGGGQKMMPAR
jgi:multidrug efflux system membrane fusion protein